ncbi:hypothetical protein MTO96_030421 [Rhipicephalus appendiculatus]
MAITAAKGTLIKPDDPSAYKIVSLNDHCDSKDHKQSLNDTSWPQSAGILTASQLRDLRGTGENGCSFEFSAPGSSGLIVSVIEMNLRMGLLNESCLDYISVITKFNFGSDKDERCGRITSEQNYHFATTHSLQLKLFSKTPLTNFFDDYILAVVATSYAESQDGVCGPDEFQCISGGRCIHRGYRCDNVNNCGDNSDEAQLGNSMCRGDATQLIGLDHSWLGRFVDYLVHRMLLLPSIGSHQEKGSAAGPQEKGNAFRNPLAATLRTKEDEQEEPAAAKEGAS